MDTKQEIAQLLIEKRPKLAPSSLKTYTSFLSTLLKKLPTQEGKSVQDIFEDFKSVLEYLKDSKPDSTKKTILSALFIITNKPAYREEMLTLCKEANEKLLKQQKSEVEKENWVTHADIINKFHELLPTAQKMLLKKEQPNFPFLNRFILFCLSSGLYIPPRRSLDYSLMRIKGYNPNEDNLLSKDFVLNFVRYKTSQYYGSIQIPLKETAPELVAILKRWIKINPTEYLLFSKTGTQLQPSQVTKYNNDIWDGKHVSCNMYRHSYLTNFYEHKTPSLQDIHEISRLMSHSISTSLAYAKKD